MPSCSNGNISVLYNDYPTRLVAGQLRKRINNKLINCKSTSPTAGSYDFHSDIYTFHTVDNNTRSATLSSLCTAPQMPYREIRPNSMCAEQTALRLRWSTILSVPTGSLHCWKGCSSVPPFQFSAHRDMHYVLWKQAQTRSVTSTL